MVKDGWVICPRCGKKQFRIGLKTIIKSWYCICKKCKYKFQVDIESRE